MKAAAQFMGNELLPLMGISGTIRRIAPTEQVWLQIKDFQQDFNYEMKEGSWKNSRKMEGLAAMICCKFF